MSHFDFPRIHVRGLVSIDVGTANNDDYASYAIAPTYNEETEEPKLAAYARLPMRLADTDQVQPTTFGKGDDDFKRWASNKVTVLAKDEEGKEKPTEVIPAEWNYYGDMGMHLSFDYPSDPDDENSQRETSVVRVASVQTEPSRFFTPHDDLSGLGAGTKELLARFLGARLSWNKWPDNTASSTAMMIDCSQEGSSQSSQIFADNLLLQNEQTVLLGRKLDGNGMYAGDEQPSKASTLWMSFQRNVSLAGPIGCSGTFQMVMPFGPGVESTELRKLFELDPSPPPGRKLAGVVFRFTLLRVQGPYRSDKEKLIALFAEGKANPGIGQLVGTLAPWYEDDENETFAPCRLLNPTCFSQEEVLSTKEPECKEGTFEIPKGCEANGKYFRLGPIMARADSRRRVLSLDVSLTFPEEYKKTSDASFYKYAYNDDTVPAETNNPKYKCLGQFKLMLTPPASGDASGPGAVEVATLGFTEAEGVHGAYGTEAYYTRGGMIDVPLDFKNYTEEELAEGTLSLTREGERFLDETELVVIPERPTLYTEQEPLGGSARVFNFNGKDEPCRLSVYRRGKRLTAEEYAELARNGRGLILQEFWLNPYELQATHNSKPCTPNRAIESLDFQLSTDVGQAGTKILVVTREGADWRKGGPLDNQMKIDTMVHPILFVRILPNEDYSRYYEEPSAAEPVGNETLTFGVIYEKVFRNYHLLYPQMSKMVPLNDPQQWAGPDRARQLMTRLDAKNWRNFEYMPRTRDLSRSRRTLIEAWARRILSTGSQTAARAEKVAMPPRAKCPMR